MHFLALEIGGSKIQLCAGTGEGEILDRRRFTVDRAAGGEGIRGQLSEALPEMIEQWVPAAIGVGYGGPVRWRTGEIIKSYHIAGWDGFPLGEWLKVQTGGLPVFVENDSNTAAFGEAIHGAGRGFNPVLYSNLGSGVGGGLVVDGQIYHGAEPGEVEVGHLRLERDGTIVEDRCSGWGVDRRIRAEIEKAPESLLGRLAQGAAGGEAKHLPEALRQGDALAERILRESMREYAFALSHAVHLLHPAIIVIGGGLSLIGEPLRAAVEDALPGFVMDAFHPVPRLVLAALGEDVVPIGALALAAARLQVG